MKNDKMPYLIFDFDGTLVDSYPTVLQKFNQLADKFNFKKINDDDVNHIRHLTSTELIKYLKIPLYKIPRIVHAVRNQVRSEILTFQSFGNLPEVLNTLAKKQIPMGILTSNSSENVTEWLVKNDLLHLFNFVHGGTSFFGKKHILSKLLKNHKIDKQLAFYIGDETRDIQAAKECGIQAVAVTWGFNSEHILSQFNPHYLLKIPDELLKLV